MQVTEVQLQMAEKQESLEKGEEFAYISQRRQKNNENKIFLFVIGIIVKRK